MKQVLIRLSISLFSQLRFENLTTLFITILIFTSLYYGINRHGSSTNEQSYDKLLTVQIIPHNRLTYDTYLIQNLVQSSMLCYTQSRLSTYN